MPSITNDVFKVDRSLTMAVRVGFQSESGMGFIADEKVIEASLEALISRVQDLKNAISSFLFKLEHESLNWPQVLDNFALMSGQINTLNKLMKSERMPILRNLVLLPIQVSRDRDEQLEACTEGRISAFSHEVVPDALRTKHIPEVEKEEQRLSNEAVKINPEDAQKQVENLNELSASVVDLITSARERWEGDSSSQHQAANPSQTDTNVLIAAITRGSGLRKSSNSSVSDSGDAKSSASDSSSYGKAQSSYKASMKAAASNLPYGSSRSQMMR